jgi:molybdenum cofactor biosynthesis protein B
VGQGDAGHHQRDALRVRLALITVSDTRSGETDSSGALLRRLCEEAGHRVLDQSIVRDEREEIAAAVREAAGLEGCQAVLLTGGTGLAARDNTHEAVAGLLHKRLDGFGELFRALSYEEIGPAAMLSRALAGTLGPVFVAALPGSRGAVRLALEKLILPQLGHIAGLLSPQVDSPPGSE